MKNSSKLSPLNFSRAQLAVFAVVFAGIGGFFIYKSFAATVYYISPSGNDANNCSQSAPCQSFNKAYQVATPGDTVQLAGGNYGFQNINWRPDMANRSPGCDPKGEWGGATTANCITFVPAPGANVVTNTFGISGSGVYIKGTASPVIAGPSRTYNFKVNGEILTLTEDGTKPPDYVTVEGVDANALAIYDSKNVLFKNLDSGGRSTVDGCARVDENGQSIPDTDESKIGSRRDFIPTAVVVDGVYFHDTYRTASAIDGTGAEPCHDGALFFINGNGVTIRNSVWSQNWVYDIQVQNFNGRQYPTNVLIENNWFGCGVYGGDITTNPAGVNSCNGQSAIQFDAPTSNWLIRYNSTGPGTSLFGCYVGTCLPYTNVRVIGNVGSGPASGECTKGAVFSYNAFDTGPCSATDVDWNSSFVSTTVGAENFHLSNGSSNADGLVTPTSGDYALNFDIDGQSRSAPRDAGSDEFGSGTQPPPPPPPPDTQPPTVSMAAPGNNATVSGANVAVSASASDNVGIARVQFRLDGNNLGAADTSSPYSINWDSTTASNGSHTLTAIATDTSNNSTASASVPVTVNNTVAPPPSPPPPPDTTPPTVSISSPADGSTVTATVIVSATATDNVAVSRVEFFVDGALRATDTTSPYNYSWDTTALPNGNHNLIARAYDAAGNSRSDSYTIIVNNGDTTPPSVPTNPTATASAYNRVNLSWAASSDNVAVTGYYIVRNGVTIANSASVATTYADTTVSASTAYTYQVIAYDARGNNSPASNNASVTTPAQPDTTPPSAPANLSATAHASSQIDLSWLASTDNIAVTGYDVYRSVSGSPAVRIATVTTTSFGNTGLSGSTTYAYYVVARDAAGNSSIASTTANTTTPAAPGTTPPPQATGRLVGRVSSSDGGGVRATVRVFTGSGKRAVTTTSHGYYSLPNLPTGRHETRYSADRHATDTTAATIRSGQTTTKNVTLQHR